MPMVQVTMLEGRTADQKRKLAQRITDAMVEEAGARREAVVVAIHEVSKRELRLGRRAHGGQRKIALFAAPLDRGITPAGRRDALPRGPQSSAGPSWRTAGSVERRGGLQGRRRPCTVRK